MLIFGYSGEFGGPQKRDALRAFGASEAGSIAHCVTDGLDACWGPTVMTEGPLTVALSGSPALEAGPSASEPLAAILARYRAQGADALRALTGPFAVAILDRSALRVVLAIDRMGISTLAYSVRTDGIVFSTSALNVARSPVVGARLDPQSIFAYLLHHVIPAPATVFQHVHKLRAGSYAVYEKGTVKVARYWVPRFEAQNHASFQALKKELHQSLHQAVTSQLDCGEGTGAFLSGGLDSSTVAGILSSVGGETAKTFSIGFGYRDYDELDYARIVNDHFGCRGHERVIRGQDIVQAFPEIARAYDEPFGNSSALPTYHCARLAREHGITHLLAGDGGDELFGGNSRYSEQLLFERYRHIPAIVRRGLLEPLLAHWPASLRPPIVRSAQNYVRQARAPLPERLEYWNLLTRLGLDVVLCPDFLAAVDLRSPFECMRKLWDSTPSDAYLHRMLYYDWQYTLADNDLRKVQTMSALAGVRVSYPMLHSSVVDVSTRVPPGLMMPGRKLRDFYKRAMGDFLPEAVIRKKKHGFGLPFGLWLQESADLRDLIFANLSDARRRGIVQPEFLDRLLRLHSHEDARYYGVFIWVISMLEQWMQEHGASL